MLSDPRVETVNIRSESFLFACKSVFLGSIVVLASSNGQENEVFRDKCVLITMFQINL